MDQDQLSLEQLQERIRRFVQARDWEQFHTPTNLALSAAIELGELLELFQWKTTDQIDDSLNDPQYKEAVSSEIADVMIYLLRLADRVGIEASSAILKKMMRNEKKYPSGSWKGTAPNKLNRRGRE